MVFGQFLSFRDELKAFKTGSKREQINKISVFLKQSSLEKQAVLHNEIGLLYHTVNLDSAEYHHRQAVIIANKTGVIEEQGIAHNKLGVVKYLKFEIDSALLEFNQALIYFKSEALRANVFNNLALMHKILQEPNKAVEAYLSAYALFEKNNDFKKEIDVLNNLSALCFSIKNDSAALMYAREAKAMSISYHDEDGLAVSKINEGIVLVNLGQLEKAEKNYKETLEYYTLVENPREQIICLNNLALIYGKREDINLELESYNRAIALAEKHQINGYLPALNLNIGSIYELKLEWDTAVSYYLKALRLAQAQNNKNYLVPIYRNLAKVYKSLEQIDSSLYFKEKEIAFKDSIDLGAKTQKMIDTEAKYRNKALKNNLKQASQKEKHISYYLIWSFVGLTVLSLILMVIAFLYRRLRRWNLRLSITKCHIQRTLVY